MGEAAASLPGERFPRPSAREQLLAQSRAGGRSPPALRQGRSRAAERIRLSLLQDLSCHRFRWAVDNKDNKLLVCRGHRIPWYYCPTKEPGSALKQESYSQCFQYKLEARNQEYGEMCLQKLLKGYKRLLNKVKPGL